MSNPTRNRSAWRWLLLLAALSAVLGACMRPPRTEPVTPQPSAAPQLPELPAGTWTEVPTGGETACSDGSPYAFYVHPGTVNKLVLDFEGGGACWNGGTCGQNGPYKPTVTPLETIRRGASGIYNRDNPDNPVRDWYHVFVSYCTADVHLGDSVQRYDTREGERTVYHYGQKNTAAVLDWVFSEFSALESVFVTGCSAGAYGAVAYTPRLAERYPGASVTQLGDCGAGVTPENFAEAGLARWNVAGALPPEVDLDLGGGAATTFLADTYAAVGERHPESVLAQYNSALDETQIAFYALQRGVNLAEAAPQEREQLSQAWAAGLAASLASIEARSERFHAYTSLLDEDDTPANGTAHCVLWRPELYTLETDGVPFVDWLDDLVNARQSELKTVTPPDSSLPF